jgi:hypothetical protein
MSVSPSYKVKTGAWIRQRDSLPVRSCKTLYKFTDLPQQAWETLGLTSPKSLHCGQISIRPDRSTLDIRLF